LGVRGLTQYYGRSSGARGFWTPDDFASNCGRRLLILTTGRRSADLQDTAIAAQLLYSLLRQGIVERGVITTTRARYLAGGGYDIRAKAGKMLDILPEILWRREYGTELVTLRLRMWLPDE